MSKKNREWVEFEDVCAFKFGGTELNSLFIVRHLNYQIDKRDDTFSQVISSHFKFYL